MTENEIAREIVDAAYKIHTTLGPGLLESVYEAVLAYELQKRGLNQKAKDLNTKHRQQYTQGQDSLLTTPPH